MIGAVPDVNNQKKNSIKHKQTARLLTCCEQAGFFTVTGMLWTVYAQIYSAFTLFAAF